MEHVLNKSNFIMLYRYLETLPFVSLSILNFPFSFPYRYAMPVKLVPKKQRL